MGKLALPTVLCGHNVYEIGLMQGVGLERVREHGGHCVHAWEGKHAHWMGCDARTHKRAPSGDEEAEHVARAEGDAAKEGTLFTPDPVVILDVVRECECRV